MAEIEMNIIRKKNNFTIIDNGIFKDNSLSAKAKGILTTMLSLPADWNYSITGLTTLFNDSETSIRTGLQELEKAGYLKRERLYENGKIVRWKYTLYEVKQVENLDVENQQVENLQVENLQLEDRAQLNTNKLSTKELSKKEIKTNSKELVEQSSLSNGSDNFLGSINTKPKKENRYSKCLSMIYDYTDDIELQNLLKRYLSLRFEMIKDKEMYTNQWKGLLNKLNSLTDDIIVMRDIVSQSIEKGYASFYPLAKNYNGSFKKSDLNQGCEITTSRYTEEELNAMEELNKQREAQGLQTKF